MAWKYLVLIVATVAACPACSDARSSSIHRVQNVQDVPVTFQNGDATLSGTLFLPEDGRRHPAVVLFHGSGAQSRDLFTGRWFAEHGVAALTYDKRGVNASTGDFRRVPFTDLVDDGLAAVALLKARADIDSSRIGVWGLSQGGWLGPLAASRSRDIAFVIAVSGPGVSPGEQMIFYYGNQLRDRGFGDADVEAASDLRRKIWRLYSTGEDADAVATALDRSRSERWFGEVDRQTDGFLSRPTSAIVNDVAIRERIWFRREINYDPTIALRALTAPTLFIFGDQDALVPVERSVAIIRQTLTDAGRRDFSIVVFPGADHAIRTLSADGGQRLASGYLDTMEDWLRKTLDR